MIMMNLDVMIWLCLLSDKDGDVDCDFDGVDNDGWLIQNSMQNTLRLPFILLSPARSEAAILKILKLDWSDFISINFSNFCTVQPK